LFDFGDATTPGEGRSRTNVAPQALYMMNGRAVSERALHLAQDLISSNRTDPDRVAQVFRRMYGREPSAEETKDAVKYLQEYKMKFPTDAKEAAATPTLKAWQSFCRLMLSSNEFIYVD